MMTLKKNKNKALFDIQKYDKCSFSVLYAAYSPVNHDENLFKTRTRAYWPAICMCWHQFEKGDGAGGVSECKFVQSK